MRTSFTKVGSLTLQVSFTRAASAASKLSSKRATTSIRRSNFIRLLVAVRARPADSSVDPAPLASAPKEHATGGQRQLFSGGVRQTAEDERGEPGENDVALSGDVIERRVELRTVLRLIERDGDVELKPGLGLVQTLIQFRVSVGVQALGSSSTRSLAPGSSRTYRIG